MSNFLFRLDESTGLIDYDKLEMTASLFRPKMIIAGFSAYARHLDYAKFRQICDKVRNIQTRIASAPDSLDLDQSAANLFMFVGLEVQKFPYL